MVPAQDNAALSTQLYCNQPLCVMKFGGTSVGSVERIKYVASLIKKRQDEGFSLVIVVSAMGHETDRLVSLAEQISPHPARRELDMLLSTGERISMALLSIALNDLGVPAISFTGSQSGIITDTRHNRAKIVTIHATRLETELERGRVVIVAGFQGVSREKEVTTLGRGGSDTTAVALAGALGAARCEIFTDVQGVYTVDPRIRTQARKIDRISYDEMIELAGAGSHVLEVRSVLFAKKFNIPLWVLSSFEQGSGTLITHEGETSEGPILGIAMNNHESILTLTGMENDLDFIEKLLLDLSENNVPVELLYQQFEIRDRVDFSIAIPDGDFEQAQAIMKRSIDQHKAEELVTWNSLSRVSIIGRGMKGVPGILLTLLNALKSRKIPVFLVSTADLRISAFVPRKMSEEAISTIAEAFSL